MGRGVVAVASATLAVALLAGCASHPAPAARTAASEATVAAPGSAPLAACPTPRRHSRFREMTWAEYYNDVKERAWRNAAIIIWITPPKVRKPRAAPQSGTTACAR